MRTSLRSKVPALIIAHALFVQTFALAQQSPRQATRPRRTQSGSEAWPATPSDPTGAETTRLTEEPVIRIGLATDARTVAISSAGHLLNVTGVDATPSPLAANRVRIEAHRLAPLPVVAGTITYGVEVAGTGTRSEADRTAQEIRDLTGDETQIIYDTMAKTWRIQVGHKGSRNEAEDILARLEDAGFLSAAIVDERSALAEARDNTISARNTGSDNTPALPVSRRPVSSSVRPVSLSSVPTRELVAYTAGSARLFSSRAPVVFASDDEQNSPVRLNEKPYRGRLEVFANPRGLLTVVNVVGLEEYVRGVVPNELSPGGYPAIEALKAQAVAARTYAYKNRGNFAAQGFDLLPTTRSQVYGGLSTEHPLASRAVEETRGIIATYGGEPINALYTSTCGGRTEDAENIFGNHLPYLLARECAPEGKALFAPLTIKSSREPADIRDERNAPLSRLLALLAVHDFRLTATRITDAWLGSAVTAAEVRDWLSSIARLARQPLPSVATDDITRPPAFSTALTAAVFGPGRADTLLNNADVEYLLAFRDAAEVPGHNRADVALLLRDGFLSLYPDATLRPREAMTRAHVIQTFARLLEARSLLQLQKGTARPAAGGALILRSSRSRDLPIRMSGDAYLFRAFGDGVYQMRSVVLVGGEPVTFHVDSRGEVDYLEVRPAPNGAAADRFSPVTNWAAEMTLAEAQSRLSRWARDLGHLRDLRVAARGPSRRVTDLEIIGTSGTAHLRGGRIRSVLGLREQLFVIDRRYDAEGRVAGFVFTGRGWGHGVGMCQVGAYGLARAGWTYDKILKAYYTSIDLTKLY